jgi:2-oxo-4-hydroxy-4-carboxy--5-ureidoimidazoline (OHCU) decarboxylase
MSTKLRIKFAVDDETESDNPGAEISRLATEMQRAYPHLTFAQCRDNVLREHPDLAGELYAPVTDDGARAEAVEVVGEEIVRLAEVERASNPKLSFAQARDIVLRANPTLAQQWVARGETE